jgi:transcription elongation factor Elf1
MDLESLYGNQELDFTCPGCNHQFKIPFSSAIGENNVVICPECNASTEIQLNEESKQVAEDISSALSDLEDAFKKFGR